MQKEKNRDKYRTRFCDESFYTQNQTHFLNWKNRFQNYSRPEKMQAWVVALACLRRPRDWFGGPRPSPHLHDTPKHRHPLDLAGLFAGTPVHIPPKLNPALNLIDFINGFHVKALPEACFRSLSFISSGRYPMLFSETAPTPNELLALQISGRRIISFTEVPEEWPHTLYAGRDFLGFILHDLIHADHFFHAHDFRDGQLGFYLFLEKILHEPSLKKLLDINSFREGFDYIISDMNSHPLHLFQTFHSLLFLSLKNDSLATKNWQNWVGLFGVSEAESHSLSRLNSDTFTAQDARTIEAFCIKKGQNNSSHLS